MGQSFTKSQRIFGRRGQKKSIFVIGLRPQRERHEPPLQPQAILDRRITADINFVAEWFAGD